MGVDLSVKIHDTLFKNPVIPASGTFGFGKEISEYYDLSILGGIVSKGITRHPRTGNPPIRIAETDSGILNSVGLQNMGVEKFISHEAKNFVSYGCVGIVNISGGSVEDYVEISKMLNNTQCDIIELNLSCPNVKEGMAFGSTCKGVYSVVSEVMKITDKKIWVKLTPNTTDIKETARACEEAGAHGISLINTLQGMAVDLKQRRPVLYNNYGGLSGPAIKPVALRMVNEVYNTVNIPVIGMGGISNARDVLEFIVSGASLVQIGTGNLLNPFICKEIIDELPGELLKLKETSIKKITGTLKLW